MGGEDMYFDIMHDEATGRKIAEIVATYLDAMTDHLQGNIKSGDLHNRRSTKWRQARDVLEKYKVDGTESDD
jgi:hypothetical protein